jgi:hypothetical protein
MCPNILVRIFYEKNEEALEGIFSFEAQAQLFPIGYEVISFKINYETFHYSSESDLLVGVVFYDNFFSNLEFEVILKSDDGTLCRYVGIENEGTLQEIGTGPLVTFYETLQYVDGEKIIVGCTDPSAINYNPLAEIDDGSCMYEGEPEPPVVIEPEPEPPFYKLGCTNPFAINYDPLAQINDGSCLFKEGCTLPFADNYDPEAQVDDGSCSCDSYNVYFDLDGDGESIKLPESSGSCVGAFSFDYSIGTACEDILDVFIAKDGKTKIKDILGGASLHLEIRDSEGGDILFEKEVWRYSFDVDAQPLKIRDDLLCEDFYEIYAAEMGADCGEAIKGKFKGQRVRAEIPFSGLQGKSVFFSLKVSGLVFKHCLYINKIFFDYICRTEKISCLLSPSSFGFSLDRRIDNKKIAIGADQSILNSKEVEVRINPYKRIEDSIDSYHERNGKIHPLRRMIFYSRSTKDKIYPIGRMGSGFYPFLEWLFASYESDPLECGGIGKRMSYKEAESSKTPAIAEKATFLENLLPATSISRFSTNFYKNTKFHQPKYRYREYTIDEGCDAKAGFFFEILEDDDCIKKTPFKSRFEEAAANAGFCPPCSGSGTGITYSYFRDGVNLSSRLIQYPADGSIGPSELISHDSASYEECPEESPCGPGCTVFETGNFEIDLYIISESIKNSLFFVLEHIIFNGEYLLQSTFFDEYSLEINASNIDYDIHTLQFRNVIDWLNSLQDKIVFSLGSSPDRVRVSHPANCTFEIKTRFNDISSIPVNGVIMNENGIVSAEVTFDGVFYSSEFLEEFGGGSFEVYFPRYNLIEENVDC